MSTIRIPRRPLLAAPTLVALSCLVAVVGCATPKQPTGPSPTTNEAPQSLIAPASPVVRYSRYRLVELTPDQAQIDLMQQIIDVTISPVMVSTVADALRYVLRWSGYQLCENAPERQELEALPLPAAHLHLGPMTLRDALAVLAGPAWHVDVDEGTRRVCFEQPQTNARSPISPPSVTSQGAQP
jgi:conjugative transfer region protein (TIGR03748 family)